MFGRFALFLVCLCGLSAPALADKLVMHTGSGQTMVVRDAIANLDDYRGWNDAVTAVEVHSGAWELCREAYFSRCTTVRAGTRIRNLSAIGLSGQMSSLRPLNQSGYDDRSGWSNRDNRRNGGWNDRNRWDDDRDWDDDDDWGGVFGNGSRGPQPAWPDRQRGGSWDDDRGQGGIVWNGDRWDGESRSDGNRLSSCQSHVLAGVQERYGHGQGYRFSGGAHDGQLAYGGAWFNYSCRNGQTYVWQ